MSIIERVKTMNARMEEFEERVTIYENKLKQLNNEFEDIYQSSTLAEFEERRIQFNKQLQQLKQEYEEISEERSQLIRAKQQLEGGSNE